MSEELDFRNRLLNLSITSAECNGSIEVERRNSDEMLVLRPTIHVTIEMPFGQAKTTLSERIKMYVQKQRLEHPIHKVSSATYASIVGSIDEKGVVTPPLSFNFKGGTIILDEFQTSREDKQSSVEACLDVLENEYTSRQVARQPNKTNKIFYSQTGSDCEIGNGIFHFWNLRANWIFLTARNLQMNRQLGMQMLLSRTVPVMMNLNRDALRKIDDNPKLMFDGMHYEPISDMRIYNDDYLVIRDFIDDYYDKYGLKGNYFRTINDCVRVFAIEREHDTDMYEYILRNKFRYETES